MWDELRTRVERALDEYLVTDAACPDRLKSSMRYSVLAGGKRLRPVLVLLSCDACGGEIESAVPAAVAIELIHTYSLIHDDLPAMDDDDLRRGRPTNHRQFDEATAILAGDGLLTLAFEILARDVQPAEVAVSCVVDLASAAGIAGMVGGQMADLQGERPELRDNPGCSNAEENNPGCSNAERARAEVQNTGARAEENDTEKFSQLEAIHLRKTGRLLRSALTMGARIARAEPETVELMDHFGKCVGLAFQITDDLLDFTGDAAKMGKAVRKDAESGKLTYPGLLGVEESRRRAEYLIEEARRSIAPLGTRGQRLDALAHFVLERDH